MDDRDERQTGPPEDQGKNRATALFGIGVMVFWFCGFGSCIGLSSAVLKMVYPFIIGLGLALQIAGMVVLGSWAGAKSGRKIGCLMTIMGLALVAAFPFALFSLAIVYGGARLIG
jgi:hypothetical protein